MEFLEKAAQNGLVLLVVGVLVGAGIRLADWVIPAPDTRIVVCTEDRLPECRTLNEIRKSSRT